jgi:hypothetical protein
MTKFSYEIKENKGLKGGYIIDEIIIVKNEFKNWQREIAFSTTYNSFSGYKGAIAYCEQRAQRVLENNKDYEYEGYVVYLTA